MLRRFSSARAATPTAPRLVTASSFEAGKLAALVADAVSRAGGPERVNDSPRTAPSKRLEQWIERHAPVHMRYSDRTKVRHGAGLAVRLGLPAIRKACPRFDAWLSRLEGLAYSYTRNNESPAVTRQ